MLYYYSCIHVLTKRTEIKGEKVNQPGDESFKYQCLNKFNLYILLYCCGSDNCVNTLCTSLWFITQTQYRGWKNSIYAHAMFMSHPLTVMHHIQSRSAQPNGGRSTYTCL